MKIVHLVDYFQPVLGYQETFLAREQLKQGHTVTVVTSDRYAPFPDYDRTIKPVLGERIQPIGRRIEEGIPVWRLPVHFERGFRCWLAGLSSILAQLHPDVIHAHGIIKLSTLQLVLAKPNFQHRLLVDDHMHQVNVNHKLSGKLFYKAFQVFLAPLFQKQIDVVTAITPETASIVKNIYGFHRIPVQVIELGVDTALFAPHPVARQKIRSELGLATDDFLVIYTGKIIRAKAPHWLLETLPHCPPNVKVLLVGNIATDYQVEIEAIITHHQLQSRVFLQSAVRQTSLPDFYVAADAGCWPRETSLAMLEGAACGLPIVVSRGEVAERVSYNNGLEYEEGNIVDLAQCLTQLAKNPTEAQAMGSRGRKLVEDKLSWAEINRQFIVTYQNG